jgi:hypothetical protein
VNPKCLKHRNILLPDPREVSGADRRPPGIWRQQGTKPVSGERGGKKGNLWYQVLIKADGHYPLGFSEVL